MKRSVEELLAIFRAKEKQGNSKDAFWGLEKEPSAIEICVARLTGQLTPWKEGGQESTREVQGDKTWHVGRIAWLTLYWSDNYPVKMVSKDDYRGHHRVLAAHFLGKLNIEVDDAAQ